MIGAPLSQSIRFRIEAPTRRRWFVVSAQARRYAVAFGLGLAAGAVWMFVYML